MAEAVDGAFGDARDLHDHVEVDAVLGEGDGLGARAGVEGEATHFGVQRVVKGLRDDERLGIQIISKRGKAG